MNVFISITICIFAAYGVWQLLTRLTSGMVPPGDTHIGNVYTVMAVRNREETIEGMIRSAVWRAISYRGGKRIDDIVVLDLGSEDETKEILERLDREYDFIHVMSREDYINAVREY